MATRCHAVVAAVLVGVALASGPAALVAQDGYEDVAVAPVGATLARGGSVHVGEWRFRRERDDRISVSTSAHPDEIASGWCGTVGASGDPLELRHVDGGWVLCELGAFAEQREVTVCRFSNATLQFSIVTLSAGS